MTVDQIKLELDEGARVSGLFIRPAKAKALFVFAHGAGAGMTHAFMEDAAQGLARRGIATLRFNFPFMEAREGARWGRTDKPAVAQGAVRAALIEAGKRAPELPIFAGGKSFGARMASQMQAQEAFPGLQGLVFVGFPLHPAKKPSAARAEHLKLIDAPMLFVQGTKDALADMSLLAPICASLHDATLHTIEGVDHSFHAPARLGRKDHDILAEICDVIAEWTDARRPSVGAR